MKWCWEAHSVLCPASCESSTRTVRPSKPPLLFRPGRGASEVLASPVLLGPAATPPKSAPMPAGTVPDSFVSISTGALGCCAWGRGCEGPAASVDCAALLTGRLRGEASRDALPCAWHSTSGLGPSNTL